MRTITLISRISAVMSLLCALGCGDLPPEGLDCEAVHPAGEDLPASLQDASPGDCVLLLGGDYSGGLTIPAGVTLAAARGAEVRVEGIDDGSWAIELEAGAALVGVAVHAGGWKGVLVKAGPALLQDVSIEGASTALKVECSGAGCRDEERRVDLLRVDMRTSRLGLWASGAHVRMTGGSSSDNASSSLSGGYAVMASHGAHLEIRGAGIERNEVGLLMDGAETTGHLEDVRVSENTERGIWVQGLRGTLEAPALRIQGESTLIERNHMVGVGMTDALGIIVVDSVIRETISKPIQVDNGGTAQVGDGIGIFGGSGEVLIERAELDRNARAQLIVNEGTTGIIVVDSVIRPSESGHGIVVQSSTLDPSSSEESLEEAVYDVGLPTSSSKMDLPNGTGT